MSLLFFHFITAPFPYEEWCGEVVLSINNPSSPPLGKGRIITDHAKEIALREKFNMLEDIME